MDIGQCGADGYTLEFGHQRARNRVMNIATKGYGGVLMAAEHGPRLVMPIKNAERGKKLFVDNGCVAYHAINGIGDHDAPSIDAHKMNGLMLSLIHI